MATDSILSIISIVLGTVIIILGGVWTSTLRPVFQALALQQNLTMGIAMIVAPVIFAIVVVVLSFYLLIKRDDNQTGDKK